MTDTAQNLFAQVPFDEAFAHIRDLDTRMKELMAQGAVFGGKSDLDAGYTTLSHEAAEYASQFSEAELRAITAKAMGRDPGIC